MLIRPTSSYEIVLPEWIVENYDGPVASYWEHGHELLLQLSSYRRTQGESDMTASERLHQRVQQDPQHFRVSAEQVCWQKSVDQAIAEKEENGALWLFCYLVWPHLTIFATIIGPAAAVRDSANWARKALETLALCPQ